MSEAAIRVLLIEDHPGDVGLIRAYLCGQGEVPIELEHAETLSAGLCCLARSGVDVVLLDLGLPDSFGPETLHEVLHRYPATPVVVLTGEDRIEQALEGVRAGASDYLFKGRIDGPLLIRTLRFAVERAERRKVAVQLAEAEQRYRTLFEESPDGIVLVDPETGLAVDFNDAACEQLDYSREEFAPLQREDYETGETADRVRERVAEVLREGACRYEARHLTRRGEIRHVVVTAQAVELAERRLLHYIHRDVTERIAAEEALRESEQRFRSLVETTSDWIWAVNRHGNYIYSSPKVKDVLGYEAEEIVGKSLSDLVVPRQADRFRASIRKCMAQGAPIVRLERMAVHKCGRPVLLETNAAPVVNADGTLMGYRGIDRDITEVKEALDSLRERERRYSQLLAAVTSYAYSVKIENGQCVSTAHGNGCVCVTGYEPRDYEVNPHLWISMVHPDDRNIVETHVDAVLAGEVVPPIEHRIFRRDGTIRWIRNTMIPHRNGDALERYDGLVEDITERKKAETSLRDRDIQLLTAQKIQENLLPGEAPALPGFDIAGLLHPAEFAAGDYYDYLSLRDGKIGVVVGDVSGHGFAPALIMACTHVILRLLAETHSGIGEILTLANAILSREMEDDRFVTVMLTCLDPDRRLLTYVNAGHPSGYVLDASGALKAQLFSGGFPLGIVSDAEYSPAEPVSLQCGDVVLLLTDGFTEATSPDGEFFGSNRAVEAVRAERGRTAREIVDHLYKTVCEFSQCRSSADDITAVVIKVTA